MTNNPSYLASQTELWYGDGAEAWDLRPHLRGSLAMPGNVSTHRERVLADGVPGLTADAISCGVSFSGTFRYHSTIDDVLEKPQGIIFLYRKDAAWCYAMPAILEASPLTSPAGGAVGVSLTFRQGPGGNLVAAAPVTAGKVAVPAGGEGYSLATAGNGALVRHTAEFDAVTVGIGGHPFIVDHG